MAVPKQRTSKSRRNSRRAQNFRLEAPKLSVCPNCNSAMMPHRVCPSCGFYKGRQVMDVKSEELA